MPSNQRAEFQKLVSLLSEASVEFVIIGGVAMELHGSNYLTYDIDFAYHRTRENARKIANVLAPYHPKPVDWPADLPFVWDDQTILNSTVLTLETDLARIDLLGAPDGAPPFPQLREAAIVFDLDGRDVHVAAVNDLIAMKRAAGRPKDKAHIAELETLNRLSEEEGLT